MRNTIDYGIDLGTTNSVIALQDGAKTRLLPGPGGQTVLPSALHIDAAGRITVGQLARERRDLHPDDTSIEFKRLMGTGDKKVFPASGKVLTPEEMSAEVLRELLRWAETSEPIRAAVITVPAMFQLPQCEATRRAAELAGIAHAPLLQEPIAAAIAHSGSGNIREGYWMVYDLGGGTFDVSLVRSRGGRLQVLDHDGDNHLGGRDFDRVVARRAVERVREEKRLGEFRRSDPAHADAFARLKMEAERLRIALSEKEQVTFQVGDLGQGEGGAPVGVRFDLDRGEFESLVNPLVLRTISLCKKLLSRNKVESKQLNGLVMVGGPTLTPCVPRLLQSELGVDARHVMDPMTIVASGAALFASTQKLPASLRAVAAAGQSHCELQVEYEPMTTDPAPLLVGRIDAKQLPDLIGAAVRVRRDDGVFDTGPLALNARGAFTTVLKVRPNGLNRFALELTDGAGRKVPCAPSEIAILHGLSVSKPPLSQSVGVMLANNASCWYLKKGVGLPARHTMTHTTTVALLQGQSGEAVHVPVIQGESDRADRNKVIGVLRINAEKIGRDLPTGTEVEVHLTVDEASHTTARAFVPLLEQWFDDVVVLRMESKPEGAVREGLQAQRERLKELEKMAAELDEADGDVDDRVEEIESLLEEGDRDSVDLADQMVQRMTREIDHAETHSRAGAIENEFRDLYKSTTEIADQMGEESDRRQLAALETEFWKALGRDELDLAAAKIEAVRDVGRRVLARSPGYWVYVLNQLIQKIVELGLGQKAQHVISRGKAAADNQSIGAMRDVCRELFEMMPSDQRAGVNVPSEIVSHLK